MPLTAIIADDHPMCRAAARIALTLVAPDAAVREAATLAEVMAIDAPADLVILDLAMPDSHGIAGLVEVAQARPATPILILSGAEGDEVERRVAARGAAGYVSKAAQIPEIAAALKVVLAGGRAFSIDPAAASVPSAWDEAAARLGTLTPAERRVLQAMSGGRLNKQIAHDLALSEITVKQHVKAILRKLAVVNRTQAVLLLHRSSR